VRRSAPREWARDSNPRPRQVAYLALGGLEIQSLSRERAVAIGKAKNNPSTTDSRKSPALPAPIAWSERGVRCVAFPTSIYTSMKTIQMTIDERLLKLVDKLSQARKTTRSAFIRDALEAEIRRERIREAEIRHAQGYARKPVAPGEFDVWFSEHDWGAS